MTRSKVEILVQRLFSYVLYYNISYYYFGHEFLLSIEIHLKKIMSSEVKLQFLHCSQEEIKRMVFFLLSFLN
jgi:hypothetical protein